MDTGVPHRYGTASDDTDQGLMPGISDSGIATLCADNDAVEAYPARAILPLHHRLFKLSRPLAERRYLKKPGRLAARPRPASCPLTAPPLRLPHAESSPVTTV